MSSNTPELAQPRQPQGEALEMARGADGSFDVDLYHAMDKRDEQLITDEILHGSKSDAFVYDFNIQGKQVAGISVIGAAHLARKYGGLKHRIVASTEKQRALFQFKSFPHEGHPMSVTASFVNELADEPDYYSVVVEMTDIKTGNSVQIERTEMRMERKRDGSMYERPNFATIAQSKAFRNAVLRLVPQDVQARFKEESLRAGKGMSMGEIDVKRANIIQFASKHALAFTRETVMHLSMDEISGLSKAAQDGKEAFVTAAIGLNLMEGAAQIAAPKDGKPAAKKVPAKKAKQPKETQPLATEPPVTDPPNADPGAFDEQDPLDDENGEDLFPDEED